MTYKLWDKISPINDIPANEFLNRSPFIDKQDEVININQEDEQLITYEDGFDKNYVGDVILICENERVKAIIYKDITARNMGIDNTLGLDKFMSEYFAALNELH